MQVRIVCAQSFRLCNGEEPLVSGDETGTRKAGSGEDWAGLQGRGQLDCVIGT